MLTHTNFSLGPCMALSALLALLTTWLHAPLASAYVVGSCYAGKQCSGQKLGDLDVYGAPGEVDLFNFNCPTWYAAYGKPDLNYIQICHRINGKECSNCTTVTKGQCYPVPPAQQWVGACFGSN